MSCAQLKVNGEVCGAPAHHDDCGRHSIEKRMKSSLAQLGRPKSLDSCKRMSESKVGKPLNHPEDCTCAFCPNRVVTDATRQRISESLTGIHRSAETRARMSIAQKNAWKTRDREYKRPPCGTVHGWYAHYHRDELPCGPCVKAYRAYYLNKHQHRFEKIAARCGVPADTRCMNPNCEAPDSPRTVDHVVPLSRGGNDSIDNKQILCLACNMAKFTRTIDYRELVAVW